MVNKNECVLTAREIIMRLFSSWILTALALVGKSAEFINLKFSADKPMWTCILFFAIFFVILSVLCMKIPLVNDDLFLVSATFIYAFRVAVSYGNLFLLAGICLFFYMIYFYCYEHIEKITYCMHVSNKKLYCIICIIGGLITVYVCVSTIARYLSFLSTRLDMGIFIQIFYNLKAHCNLYSTCERSRYLSHLNIHTSLFLYLLAPFYRLFPSPETLLILQAFAVVSGILPLTLMCRKIGFSNKVILGISFLYLFSVYWGGYILIFMKMLFCCHYYYGCSAVMKQKKRYL